MPRRLFRIAFFLPGLLFGFSDSFPNQKTVQPADIANIRKVSDVQISPDGKIVAYVVETPVKAGDQKNAHIWLVSTDGKQAEHPYVMSGQSDTSPRWSPDGKTLAFLSDRINPFAEIPNGPFSFKTAGAEGRSDLGDWARKEESHKHDEQIWAVSLIGGEAYRSSERRKVVQMV